MGTFETYKNFLQPTIQAISTVLELPACIWLLDETEETLRVAVAEKLLEEYVREACLRLDEPYIAYEVFKIGKTIIVPDIQKEALWKYKDDAVRMKLKSAIVTPLSTKNKYVGIFNVFIPQDKNIDFTILKSKVKFFADQLNALFINSDQRKALIEFGRELSKAVGEEKILQLIYHYTSKIMNTDNMYIALYNESEETVQFKLAYEKGNRVDLAKPDLWKQRKINNSYRTGWIIDKKESLLFKTKEEAETWYNQPGREKPFGTIIDHSWVGVPMIASGGVIGVIGIHHPTKENIYNQDDLDVLLSIATQAAIAIDNLQVRKKQCDVICGISQLILSSVEDNELLNRILKMTNVFIGKKILSDILLFNKDKNILQVNNKWLQGESNNNILEISLGKGITGWVAEHKKSLNVPDVSMEERYYCLRKSTKSEIAVPMIKENQLIGVLNIESDQLNAFTDNDFELIKAIGSMAAIAIENSRLYKQIGKEKEKQVQAINDISSSIAATLDLNKVMDSILNWIIMLLDEASLVEVQLLDTKTNDLVTERHNGKINKKEGLRIKVGMGITGWVAQYKQKVYAPDVKKDDRYIYCIESTKSEIAVPMLIQDKLIGVLNIESDQLDAFTESDVELAQAIANLSAIAIDNTRIYEQLKQRTDQLNAAYRISQATLTSDNLESLYGEIHKNVRELISADNFYIAIYDPQNEYEPFKFPYSIDKSGRKKKSHIEMELTYLVFNNEKLISATPDTYKELISRETLELFGSPSIQWLGVPLKAQGQTFGVMAVYSYLSNTVYGISEKEILAFVSEQIAMAIDRKMTEEELSKHRDHLEDVVKKRTDEIKVANSELKFANEGLRKMNKELKTAYKISQAAHEIRNLNNFYSEAHKIISDLVPSKNFFVAIYDSHKKQFTFPYYEDEHDKDYPTESNLAEIMEKGLTGYVFRTGKPLIVNSDNRLEILEQLKIVPVGTPSKSWLGVPLITDNKTIGVLAVQSYDDNIVYGETEKNILMFVSEQIGMAMERVQYYEHLEKRVNERTAKLNAAYMISQAAYTCPDLETLYKEIHRIIHELMSAKSLYIAQYDDSEDIVSFPYYIDEHDPKPESRKQGNGLTEYIIKSGIFLGSKEKIKVLERQENFKTIGKIPNYLIGLPLKTKENRIIGVLVVQSYEEGIEYTEAEKEMLQFVSEQIATVIQRVRSEEELRRNSEEIDAAYRISDAAHTVTNIDELYKKIHNIIGGLMPAKNFYIAIYNDITDSFSLPYFKDENDDNLPTEKLKKGLTGYVMRTGQPLLATPEKFETLLAQGEVEKVGTTPIDWLGVPLKKDSNIIGVLAVQSYTERVRYKEKEKSILMFVSDQIAMVIERVRTEEELRKHQEHLEELVHKRTEKLNAAYKISEAALNTENLQNFFPKIHTIISNLMSAKNFYIATYQDSINSLKFPYFCNQAGDKVPPINSSSIEMGLSGYVFRKQQALLGTPEVLKQLTEKDEVTIIGIPCESWVGVPLKVESRVIGVMAVYSYDNNVIYSEDDLNILIFISNQIAMAIDQVCAQEELNKKTEELEQYKNQLEEQNRTLHKQHRQQQALIELAKILTASIQLEEKNIFELIHSYANQIMDTDNMYIALYDEANDFVHFPLAFKNGQPTEIHARKAGGGRTEFIIREKKSIFIQTRKESEDWYKQPGRSEYMGDSLASWIGVPMMIGQKILGIIATYHPTEDYVYTEDDLKILQTMANIAAIALNNARLFNDLRDAQRGIADRERELVKSGFAMDFTHKMNNLAGTIPAWVSLIKRKLKSASSIDPKVIEYCDKIKDDIGLLLDEAHKLRNPISQPEKIDMIDVVGSIVAQVEMLVAPNIKIEFNDPDYALFPIYGIKEQIAIAIYSVIENSVKAISGNGKITIDIKNDNQRERKYIEINIADTGCGIPKDKLDSIFEYGISFWTDKKGTGYGLWRARSIIQSMTGNIQIIETKEGEGTTFRITLPVE